MRLCPSVVMSDLGRCASVDTGAGFGASAGHQGNDKRIFSLASEGILTTLHSASAVFEASP